MPARKVKSDVIEEEEVIPTKKCDNHPGRNARLITSSDGSHSEIALCDECIPNAWRNRV